MCDIGKVEPHIVAGLSEVVPGGDALFNLGHLLVAILSVLHEASEWSHASA